MIEILALALLAETVLSGAVFFVMQRSAARERGELLDRLMARDWSEYKIVTGAPVEREPIIQGSDDAKDREWAEKNGLVPV